MIYDKLFENAYNAARFFRKKNLQSLLTSESLATYESMGAKYISDEEYNEIMRMNPMQNSSYIFNKIGFNKWNGFVSRWGKENPEECERFWQSQMAF